MPPDYPNLPLGTLLHLAFDMFWLKRRSFHADSLIMARSLPLSVLGREYIPQKGPALLVMNHYHRPGFQAFWFGLAISAMTPVEIHWTITGAWTEDGTPVSWLRARISPQILGRIANVYGFTSMPPMPPRQQEVEARAYAVRRLLRAARQTPAPVIGLAPEGQDNPAGGLMRPHPGVGRLLAILNQMGYTLIPVGVYEADQALVLNFGKPFHLSLPKELTADQRDELAADQVMEAIAACLPAEIAYPDHTNPDKK